MNANKKIGFVGLGLIGGSIAKAIKTYYPDYEIVAFDKNKETLALAIQENLISTACSFIDDNFKNCHYIFLCAPVAYNNAYLKLLQPYIWEDCIITDVGSVKTSIHKEIDTLQMNANFIGGHPMAGSEKTGYINSKPLLIENAYYVLTPTHCVAQNRVTEFAEFITTLKGIPIILDCQEHDYVTSAISHLPHIIASTLVNFVEKSDTKNKLMRQLAAGGFKDITRIASSSPIMWQQICLKNQKNISGILDSYIKSLQETKKLIDDAQEEQIYSLFVNAKEYRTSIPDFSAGPIKKVFAVYCDIMDETGGIATISTILASNNISIKNIGIIHNREFEEGVLRIEFYDEPSSQSASVLLQKHRYTVYER